MRVAALAGVADRISVTDLAREAALVVGMAVLTALSAHVRLPLPGTPVPVTLQTFVVLVAGGLLGARRGALSQFAYLLLASSGLPVIAGPTLVGPTGGYLIGFVVAAAVMGCAVRREAWGWLLGGALAATAAIYACGVTWLCLVTTQGLGTGLALGVAPFLAGDILKAAAALGVIRAARPLARRLPGL